MHARFFLARNRGLQLYDSTWIAQINPIYSQAWLANEYTRVCDIVTALHIFVQKYVCSIMQNYDFNFVEEIVLKYNNVSSRFILFPRTLISRKYVRHTSDIRQIIHSLSIRWYKRKMTSIISTITCQTNIWQAYKRRNDVLDVSINGKIKMRE